MFQSDTAGVESPQKPNLNDFLTAFYATEFYLPFSGFSRAWKRNRAAKNGVTKKFIQQTNLPAISWRDIAERSAIRMRETDKADGNVRISELAVLNFIAKQCKPGTNVFEIGTFDGRTTLNLANNTPADCTIHTLDLPAEMDDKEKQALEKEELHLTRQSALSRRFEASPLSEKIVEHRADSTKFDFSPWFETCSLVFVDASHAYQPVISDSRNAKELICPGGIVLWHDYGVWKGVTDALEELEASELPGLSVIAGTSLAYWQKPEA